MCEIKIETKTCNICKEQLPLTDFYRDRNNKDGYGARCKNCRSLKEKGIPYQGSIQEFNFNKIRSKVFDDGTKLCLDCNCRLPLDRFNIKGKNIKGLQSVCKQCQSFRLIFKKYGLSKTEYIEMLITQNYCCKICKNKDILYDKLVVDHCHETGEVRGLLCTFCNAGLGMFRDNVEYMKEAIEYLMDNYSIKNL